MRPERGGSDERARVPCNLRRLVVLGLGAVTFVASGCSGEPGSVAADPSASARSSPDTVSDPSATQTASPSPPPESLNQVFDRVRSGVVRIETTGCSDVGSGSGFLIAPNLVATVAHVVREARTISLRVDGGVLRGEVVGVDAGRDLALVRAIRDLPGHVFEFADRLVDEGDPVAVLGYPLGLPLSLTQGHVTGLDRRLTIEDRAVTVFQHDTTSTGGNSGGPVVDAAGRVVGLHEAGAVRPLTDDLGLLRLGYAEVPGIKYAIPAAAALPVLSAWQNFPNRVEQPPSCPPLWAGLVGVTSRHPDAPAIAVSLFTYFDAINNDDFERAWHMLSPTVRAEFTGLNDFAARQGQSRIRDVDVQLAERLDSLTDTATVSFISEQPAAFGPSGQTCTVWNVLYTMRLDSGYWSIEAARRLRPPAPCQ